MNAPNFSPYDVSDFILQHAEPDTDVALGAFVWNEKAIQSILFNLKSNHFAGRLILGGPQVSYIKKGLENYYPKQIFLFVAMQKVR